MLRENYARMLRTVFNKFWLQYFIKQNFYDHLFPISQTIRVRRAKYEGHGWWRQDELISDILLDTPTHATVLPDQQKLTYINSEWTLDGV